MENKEISNTPEFAEKAEVIDEAEEAQEELLKNNFISELSDCGKFSYLALCSTVLSMLFGSPQDKVYRHKTIYSLVKHVQLGNNCYPTMVAMSDGASESKSDVFIKALWEEKAIKDRPIAMAEDLVSWALLSASGDGTEANCTGRYDSRTRVLLRRLTSKLLIVFEDLEKVEHDMVKMLQAQTEKDANDQQEERNRNKRNRKWKRYALIGLAAVGGGAVIGLTGGLAAPLVASGAGAILGASSAAALGSAAGLAVITSLFGAAGAGLTGYKMKRRVGGIDQFVFRPLTPGTELSITIAISGWLSTSNGESDFAIPWLELRQSNEQYYLVWETEHLLRLGGALEYILDSLVSVAASEALKYTVLSGLVAAVAWPASLLGAASIIDNPWSVCLQRATQVGKELAEVLLSRQHGHRPVTLVGYSLGARVVFYCLEEMCRRKNHAGIVEDVFLLGAPVTADPEKWAQFSTVVAGNITNGYCRSDWLLKFLYRGSSRQSCVAGLQPVEWENRRMINIDLTCFVSGHMDYRKNMDHILSSVCIRTTKESLEPDKIEGSAKSVEKSNSMPLLSASMSETTLPPSPSLPSVIVEETGWDCLEDESFTHEMCDTNQNGECNLEVNTNQESKRVTDPLSHAVQNDGAQGNVMMLGSASIKNSDPDSSQGDQCEMCDNISATTPRVQANLVNLEKADELNIVSGSEVPLDDR